MNALRSRRRRLALASAAVAIVAVPSVAVASDGHPDRTQAAKQSVKGGPARNVILLIGDGMGDSEITIARNYQVGANGRLALDTLPLTGAYTTYAVQKGDPSRPEYVTDSAASGTGWATGHKTYNGAISVLPDERPVPTILELAKAAGYRTGPLLGAFAKNNMDLEWVGPTPTRTGTAPAKCAVNAARNAAQPHLVDMTGKALDVLDYTTRGSRKGFFLQIEGASIDKQDHAANPCGQIGETVAFDAAVRKVLAYQRSHPDTLVVVTADHGHTIQIVESTTLGYTATLITHDDANMTISYATADITGSQQHTGTEVRIAAGGPQAANVLGVTNQTDLFFTMKRALGLR